MANFSKIFGLAGAAVVFAGMAYGQASCLQANVTANTSIIRAEGTTEQVAPLNFTCTGGNAATLNVQVFINPGLPITSKVTASATNTTEAVAVVNGVSTQGVLTGNGSSITFTGVPTAAGQFTVSIENVRVNATSLSVGSGTPPSITESVFVSGPGANATTLSATVAFAENGISSAIDKVFTANAAGSFPSGAATKSGANNFTICNGQNPKNDNIKFAAAGADLVAGKSLAFVVSVSENFTTAFKTAADEASQISIGGNAVNSGTRFKIVFGNVPSSVTLYVPTDPILSTKGTLTAQLTSSEAGAFSAVSPASASNLNGLNLAPVSGTAVFEITTDDPNNLDTVNVPVFAVFTTNSVAASSTAITASVSFAPVGSTNIPNFSVLSSTTTLTGSTFSACTTSLLFPFVTNQLGFDTGLAIANTSSDPFGTNGATPQAGTCSLNFYNGSTATPPPAAFTTPSIVAGSVFAQVMSGIAPGFQGYMIAQCTFQYAHGFAFVTDGVGANGGLSQGYLAGVIPDVNQVGGRPANPAAAAAAGTGESLGQ